MRLTRLLRHLLLPDWWLLRPFSRRLLQRIEEAVVASEATHLGELRLVVEGNLPLASVWRDQTPRMRAIELFAQLGVWDTECNSGVLIYLQLIDRRVEIVADRGIDACLGQPFWDAVCRQMEGAFQSGDFENGTLRALETISTALRDHFPALSANPDELPNAPLLL
ncbi:MAG: TPM domain-containing protein [Rhodobacteraceae bacterium]|uniref:TPM domain-containing protein n=1 Tax=Accumulibacter sp. TaxID=2053492 RepID=UPI0019EE3B6F|nr:TPM domain-containing protein [Accumulibacter sp.]MBE2257912.1 TPM domain-containing protein [Paracoccaceae bacterium]